MYFETASCEQCASPTTPLMPYGIGKKHCSPAHDVNHIHFSCKNREESSSQAPY